jgi:transcriptional regulator with GAF, ATPase, and Fis domain
VNCAAIPESLIESELFGHVRGAFTGATANRRGRFALADGGTLFLDEIGTLGPGVQARLLRVLQEREFEPVGSERTMSVDVRVIAATNRDLRGMVSGGRFLEDLYYRLSVIPIELPPLRDRPDDIPLLLDHFVRKHSQRTGQRIDSLEPGARERLLAYHWPGNVRELENTIERAVVLASGPVIASAAISIAEPPVATAARGLPSARLHENVEWAERESVERALRQSQGVKKDAAEILGISQRALSYYLGKYKIE